MNKLHCLLLGMVLLSACSEKKTATPEEANTIDYADTIYWHIILKEIGVK